MEDDCGDIIIKNVFLVTISNSLLKTLHWTDKFSHVIGKIWDSLPTWFRQLLVTVAVFSLAAGLQGDWMLLLVHSLKQIDYWKFERNESVNELQSKDDPGSLLYFLTVTTFGSFGIYFVVGGLLHWYFYVRQRENAHEWKIQPTKFLPPEVERQEILFGSISLMSASVTSGLLAWYAVHDGRFLTIYYKPDEYGWIWFFLQVPVIFVWQEYLMYWSHRIYHYPYLYKRFHKMHHAFKYPTAFSVTAIHPLELMSMQMMLLSPIVVFPVHWALFYAVMMYGYIHGIIDHSGIAFKAQWWQPWQPDAVFHDNHHQYFHVNFGFNMKIWDQLHGTARKKTRVYSEDIFYGRGKALNEVSDEILKNDLAERKSENPQAYKENVNVNELKETDLKRLM